MNNSQSEKKNERKEEKKQQNRACPARTWAGPNCMRPCMGAGLVAIYGPTRQIGAPCSIEHLAHVSGMGLVAAGREQHIYNDAVANLFDPFGNLCLHQRRKSLTKVTPIFSGTDK